MLMNEQPKGQPRRQGGFTIVELIVVIVLIGILSAVALPRFISLTADAHYAAVSGVQGALSSGVALFRATWTAKGHTAAQANVVGFGDGTVDSNAAGYPVGTGGNTVVSTAAHCVEIWDGVLQAGAPNAAAAAGAGVDYVASVAGTTCTYTYQEDTTRLITYASATGAVTATNAAP